MCPYRIASVINQGISPGLGCQPILGLLVPHLVGTNDKWIQI